MNKKDIDVLELMRESVIKANKDLGFLKEASQGTSAFAEQFDKKKHMPSFQIKPKSWGIKGTIDSEQVDAVVRNLNPNPTADGVQNFKNVLKKLNEALGTKFSSGGKGSIEPVEKGQTSNLNEIVSGLMVKSTIHTIIAESSAVAAGKTFETFMARLMGGVGSIGKVEPIEDIVDSEGKYISLKTVVGSTDVKGSKSGLARGIVESKNGEVTYIVCVKDSETNPFKMKTYSFSVNEDNYFSVILGKKFPKADEIRTQFDVVIKQKPVKRKQEAATQGQKSEKMNEAVATARQLSLFPTEKDELVFDAIIKNYYKEPDIKKAAARFEKDATEALAPTKTITDTQVKLFNALMGVEYKLSKESFASDLLKKIRVSSVDKKFTKEAFSKLLTLFPEALKKYSERFGGMDSLYEIYADEFGKQKIEKILKAKEEISGLSGTAEKRAKLAFQGAEKTGDNLAGLETKIISRIREDYSAINQKLGKFMKIIADLEEILISKSPFEISTPDDVQRQIDRTQPYVKTPEVDEEALAAQAKKDFFNALRKTVSETLETIAEAVEGEETEQEDPASEEDDQEGSKTQKKKISTDSQFNISHTNIKDIVAVDEDYPIVIVARESLFNAAQDNAKKFEEWAEPVFRGMFYLTQGVNQYFTEDLPSGLDVAMKGADEAKGKLSDIQKQGKTASQLEEQKQPIKKSALDDILNDLLD
jgi:hypothetical protein